MASAFNPTSFAKALKLKYSSDYVDSMTYPTNRGFAILKKMQSMGGEKFVQPVMFDDPQSLSQDFATAQSLSTNTTSGISAIDKFEVTRVKGYGMVTIDGELIEASKGDEHAFFRTVTEKIDAIMRSVARSINVALYRGQYASLGRVSAPGASTTLTLTVKEDVVNFAKGMVLQFSSAESGAALRNSGSTLTVLGVDRNAGTLTMSANVSTVTGITTGDYIFRSGDRHDSVSTVARHLAGFRDWVPDSAPSSTSFFGVDRTQDSRLGGTRYDGSSQSVEEALIDAAVLLTREGGTPDICIMNPTQFGRLTKQLGTKVEYSNISAGEKGTFSFRGVQMNTPGGTVNVVSDRDCPLDRALLLQSNTWMLGSLGQVPRILNHDGLESLRQANDDGIEVRVGWYGNTICKAPGWNCNIKLAA